MKTFLLFPIFLILWLLPDNVKAQLISISGYVTHQLTGEPVENASVFESVYGIGTITGKNGYFKLLLKPGNAMLSFSNSGFEPSELKLNLKNDSTVSVLLKPFVQSKKQLKKDTLSQTSNPDLSYRDQESRRKYFIF